MWRGEWESRVCWWLGIVVEDPACIKLDGRRDHCARFTAPLPDIISVAASAILSATTPRVGSVEETREH